MSNRTIEVSWDKEELFSVEVVEWDEDTPFGEPSGNILGRWGHLDLGNALKRIAEEMVELSK